MHPPRDKRVFDKEAISLVKAGYTVSHLCPGTEDEAGLYEGVQIITYDRPSGLVARLFQVFSLYQRAKRINAEIYHCNEVDSWGIGVALRLMRRSRCVFDVHEHYPSTFAESRFPRWSRGIVERFVRGIFRILTPFTDRIVLAKETVADDFRCDPKKKVLVRNYTPLEGIRFSVNGPIRWDEGQGPFTIVHLGLFSRVRGWPEVLKALSHMRHQNVHLKVIGTINDGSRDDFDRAIEKYDLQGRVSVWDWMPFTEAFQHLSTAQAGLVAFQPGILNHVYAMPHKMFDYMAAGLAVVLPDFAVEVAPIVRETGCGMLINPSNPDAFATVLDALIDDPDLVVQMGQKGQVAVQDRYNWEAEASRLIAMYEDLEANCL